MKITRTPVFLLIFSFCFINIGCGEEGGDKNPVSEAAPESRSRLDPTVIADSYKNTVVGVETIETREGGGISGGTATGFFIDKEAHILTYR